MASAFTVATLFDVCALLVMAGTAVATRRARRGHGSGVLQTPASMRTHSL